MRDGGEQVEERERAPRRALFILPVTAVPVANFLRILASSLSTRACSCSALAQARMSEMKTWRGGGREKGGEHEGARAMGSEKKGGAEERLKPRQAITTPARACSVTLFLHTDGFARTLRVTTRVGSREEKPTRAAVFLSPPQYRSRLALPSHTPTPTARQTSPAGRAWSAASPWWAGERKEGRERAPRSEEARSTMRGERRRRRK